MIRAGAPPKGDCKFRGVLYYNIYLKDATSSSKMYSGVALRGYSTAKDAEDTKVSIESLLPLDRPVR